MKPRALSVASPRCLPLLFLAAALLTGCRCIAQGPFPFQDEKLGTEERITDLLQRMTLKEKVAAFGTDPTVPRLGVVGTGQVEGLHGLALGGPGAWEGRNQQVIPTTTFPQARGLGQTWDPELIEQVAAVEAAETNYAFAKYHRGGRVIRAPNADLSRDPRWGRSEESYGEDPFLVGTIAAAFSRGLQGGDPKHWNTASLLKHFLANSNEDGRGGSSSDFDARLFHEYYAVPFRMAIEQGHANAMMASYNAWNHIPMTANPALREVVMDQWGFNGILCTDAGALTNMVKDHHYYADMPHAAAGAVKAGINQFLDTFSPAMNDALAQKLLTEQDLDRNLRGVFRVMLRLGMLDAKGREIPVNTSGADPWWSAKSRALARKATAESIVLLKNQNALLPLTDKIRSIAVIGPLADQVALDWYSGTPPFAVTPLAGIRERAQASRVGYSDGADVAMAAALASQADVAIVIIGNHPTCDAGWNKCPLPSDGKEAIDRKSLTLEQEELVKAVFAANPHTVCVLQTSFPYTTTWTQEHVPAILQVTHNSEEQGHGLADVLFGDENPAGRLTQTWVATINQLPPMMDYNIRNGRTYLYAKSKPLYPFGYGLSYTDFHYARLHLDHKQVASKDDLGIDVDVTNTGKRDGSEVIQVYVAHPHSRIARPVKELKGFRRVAIAAGQTKTVHLTIPAASLAYWDTDANAMMIEAEKVEVLIGGSSDNLPLAGEVETLSDAASAQTAVAAASK